MFCKKVFLKVLEDSQENISDGGPVLAKLIWKYSNKKSSTSVSGWLLSNFSEYLIYWTPVNTCCRFLWKINFKNEVFLHTFQKVIWRNPYRNTDLLTLNKQKWINKSIKLIFHTVKIKEIYLNSVRPERFIQSSVKYLRGSFLQNS